MGTNGLSWSELAASGSTEAQSKCTHRTLEARIASFVGTFATETERGRCLGARGERRVAFMFDREVVAADDCWFAHSALIVVRFDALARLVVG